MKRWKIIEAKKYEDRIKELTYAISFAESYSVAFSFRKPKPTDYTYEVSVKGKTKAAIEFLKWVETVKTISRESYNVFANEIHKDLIGEAKEWLKEHPAE